MLYYLDTVIVIYAVEGNVADNQLANFPDITVEELP